MAATVAVVAAGHALGLATGDVQLYGFHAVAAPSFTALGALILSYRPGHRVGRLYLAIGAAAALTVVAASYAHFPAAGWLLVASLPVALGLLPQLFLLFPDGDRPGGRWRWVARVAILGLGGAVLGLATAATLAAPADVLDPSVELSAGAHLGVQLAVAGTLLIVVAAAAGAGSLLARWRGADGELRQQIRVLALGASTLPVGFALDFFLGWPVLWFVLGAVVPTAATAAILRYRLYDLDLVLNRSLVYATLTVLVVGGYLAVVAVAAPMLGAAADRLPPLLATGVVAVLFHPARQRVQQAANRLLYGDRDDPYAVLTRLNRRLEQAADPLSALPQVTQTVTDALRLPYAAIELVESGGTRLVASHGRPSVVAPQPFPMTYQRKPVGRLLVSPRSASAAFTGGERRLLHELAGHAGVAAHTAQLTVDLQRSRERLVRSREEERRRLRRDLHDGLGPALAGMTMQVGAARSLLGQDPKSVDATLGRLERQLQDCLIDVRRIVDDLRPAVLDQLGLVGAIRSATATLAPPGGSGVRIDVVAEVLGYLPAAIEVAAYRIAVEAVTNVVRHAHADACRVRVTADSILSLEVTDDGAGLSPDSVPGVGLTSMRERVEELGGALTITPRAGGGTRISADLPLTPP